MNKENKEDYILAYRYCQIIPNSPKMGWSNQCYWDCFLNRKIWRNICAQRYCIGICDMVKCWVQVLFDKRVSAVKRRWNWPIKLEWNLQRTLAKVNYKIHTDAIKENLVPETLSQLQVSYTYADEADLLNMALFGITAKEWRDNP